MNVIWSTVAPTVIPRKHTLTVGAEHKYYTFDHTGRLLFYTQPGKAVRRGLDHRMVESTETTEGRTYRDLSKDEKIAFIKQINAEIVLLLMHDARNDNAEWLKRIITWTPERLTKDREYFNKIYKPISILPPDQYRSLVVQVAEGCSYNRCTFCDFYRDRPFHIKSNEELILHMQGLLNFFEDRILMRSGVFLGDGNAMVIPTPRLLEIIQVMRRILPSPLFVDGIATFMDTFSLERKSLDELKALNTAGLRSVYVGLETGSNNLRTILQKQGTAEEALTAIRNLKAAGYYVAVIILIGAGGYEYAQEHVHETLDLLREMPLTHGDFIYLSPFIEPENESYKKSILHTGVTPMKPRERSEQYEEVRKQALEIHPEVKVTLYSISQHLY